jgi:hypothetical protein
MGLRFSKSFTSGPGRINLSKSGVGISFGTKGFRVGVGPRGTYANAAFPGAGVSYRKTLCAPGGRPQADSALSAEVILCVLGIAVGLPCAIILIAAPWIALPLVLICMLVLAGQARWRGTKDPRVQFSIKSQAAMRLVAARKWGTALKNLEACERMVPGIPEMVRLRGQVLYNLHRWKEAIPLLRIGPANETERLMLADALRQVGSYRESIQALGSKLINHGLAAQAAVIQASNHIDLGEQDAAILILSAELRRGRELDVTQRQVHYLLAQAYEHAGKITDAVHHLKLIYAVDPCFMDVRSELRRLERA